tara:strand:- start:197 stop:1897 length:1701 start_codon:yes stop_codon:yes gene_type:complete
MKLISSLLLTTILLSTNFSQAQDYQAPLDFRMLLSGTFGELRGNHFHAGIDIKTEGVEGQKVYSIANGYISRIKVSTWGYGKAIYITHPETGHTSVYAHLQKFSTKIDSIVEKEHYKKESFEINFYPNKNSIEIKKGEIIALSGNSGGSSGAHLHFEIRDTQTERPINPLQFGFNITDNIPPTLKKLKIYSLDTTLINGYRKSKIMNINKKNDKYSIDEIPIINGAFAIGIFTYDKSDNSYNKNGVYKIKLCVDTNICYQFKVDELDFNTTRYINAHVDYKEKKESKNKYHRCYKLPNNKLKNYSNLLNEGIISIKDTLTHLISIEVTDIYDNKALLDFKIKSTNNPLLNRCPLTKDSTSIPFGYNKANIFKKENIKLSMPPLSLYEPLMFRYTTTDSVDGVFGEIHQVHFNNIPVHKEYTLSIKADIPDSLKSKTYIATTDMKGNFWHIGGEWKDGYLKSKVREFGDFCIIADTTNPEIKGVNIFPGKIFNTQTNIKLTIKDKNSGIKSYRGEIDGKWILMDYDYKRNLLKFDIDNNVSKGKHTFTLNLIDNVGNATDYKAKFTY